MSVLHSHLDCSILKIYYGGAQSKINCNTVQTVPVSLYDTAQMFPNVLALLLIYHSELRGKKAMCMWAHSHGKWTGKSGRNENQTRGGRRRKAIISNEQRLSLAHSLNQINPPPLSLYLRSLFPSPSQYLFLCLSLCPPFLFLSSPHPFHGGTAGCWRSTTVTGVSSLR